MGRLKFLEGQPTQFTAQAVEFAPNIVGEQPALTVVSNPVAPAGPAKRVTK
jgi:hypothetical protein